MPSEESTTSFIFAGYDPVLQDQTPVLVVLVHLAVGRMDIPCRLGTEIEDKLNILQLCHLVWGHDDGAGEMSRSEQPPLPQALSSSNNKKHSLVP